MPRNRGPAAPGLSRMPGQESIRSKQKVRRPPREAGTIDPREDRGSNAASDLRQSRPLSGTRPRGNECPARIIVEFLQYPERSSAGSGALTSIGSKRDRPRCNRSGRSPRGHQAENETEQITQNVPAAPPVCFRCLACCAMFSIQAIDRLKCDSPTPAINSTAAPLTRIGAGSVDALPPTSHATTA